MSTEQPGTPPPASETPPPQALTVPLNPDGTIGTLPAPLQQLFDARIREVTQRAAKKASPDPVVTEKLTTLEQELEQYRIKDAEAGKRYEEAIQIREAREKSEREKLQGEIERRTERLKRATHAEIQAIALRHNAREESLDELVALLSPKVSLNDDLDPVVDGADSIEALVVGYLDAKPHHRKAAGGQSMGMTGGVMTQTGGIVPKQDAVAAIQADIAKQGRATGDHLRRLREAKQSA